MHRVIEEDAMSRSTKKLLAFTLVVVLLISGLAIPAAAQPAAAPAAPIAFTILHTNDFHGQLEPSGSNPGMARVAQVANDIRTALGPDNVLLVDAGDEMQGSLLSNLGDGTPTGKGIPTISTFNAMDYEVATFGNHEFDWGKENLSNRTGEATYPYVSANIVVNDTGNCATAGWTSPAFIDGGPYEVLTVGTAPNQVKVGFIGVTTTETPIITVASSTAGLCFKDPADSILHYYDALKAEADVVVVLSHLGFNDGGYGYGIPAYGDKTLAQKLIDAGKPASLIVGGHSHTNMASTGATVVGGKTTVTQAYYNGRQLGQADLTFDPATGATTVAWKTNAVSTSGAKDPTIDALITSYATDPDYLALVNQPIGYSAVDLPRSGGTADNMMATFIDDAIYNYLNTDGTTDNDIDLFFNNAGGIRTDWCFVGGAWVNTGCTAGVHDPGLLTYGNMFTILPFGNATVVGKMTGAQILEVLNKGPQVSNGVIQPAGLKYSYFKYTDANPGPQPYAWGAFDYCVVNKTTKACEPLDLAKTYSVGTNEFLAPAGGDGYGGFKYMTGITYWGDMLNAVDAYVMANYGTPATAYKGPNGDGTLDGRIVRDGDNTSGSIIPITVLHHNDSHGNLAKGSFVGYTQLATLIKQERAHNPDRTLLLSGGDNIQGDSMMYYFKSSFTGKASDGTVLPDALKPHPLIAAFNTMNYDAMDLGNHEFNFGSAIFQGVMAQTNFPVVGANVTDDGRYGLATAQGGQGVQPYIEKTLGGVKVAVLGITNHRVPNYELPSNIIGLSFSNPIAKGQELAPTLKAKDDVVIALTHIGFTTNPKSVEVDENVDTNFAAQVPGVDAIVGSHSHTNPASPEAPYKQLPTYVSGPSNTPVIINQAYRYNNTLGELIIGVRAKAGGGYEVVSRAGQYLSVTMSTTEDAAVKAIVDPYVAQLAVYNTTPAGMTAAPIDTTNAYIAETNAANLQADAAIHELAKNNITDVDFHLSGAMTRPSSQSNWVMFPAATPAAPVQMKVSDMFTLMPYENSLVTLRMNGPQLKAVLERAYRNYYYYKYVPGFGGYSYYTTCMINTDAGTKITYNDTYPAPYDPAVNHVVSLEFDGNIVDFSNADTYYKVSTVNYLAAGSCNFNNGGVSLWPLNQIVDDTQYYVRDAVINYATDMGTIEPKIEGRLQFTPPAEVAMNAWIKQTPGALVMTQGSEVKVRVMAHNIGQANDAFLYVPLNANVAYVPDSVTGGAYPVTAGAAAMLAAKHGTALSVPEGAPANEVIGVAYDAPGFQPGDIVNFDFKVTVTTNDEGTIEHFLTISADGKLFKTLSANPVALAARVTDIFGPQQDTYIQSGAPAANYGTAAFLHVRVDAAGNDVLRSLVGYDLLSVKPESLVEKATLSVYVDAFSGGAVDGQIQAHEVTLNWAEGTATWKTPWVKPGGDFVEAAVGAASIDKSMVGKWIKIDVTPLVEQWVADPTSNHGVLLRLRKVSSITGYRFASTTNWAPENAPKLEVTYRKP
jgi:2',3'-cyclic-nucleotide 2'-phosphodiesterase (5'-nucleotidase family)